MAGAAFDLAFWREIDLSRIPRTEWVYGRFYAKGYTSVTASAPKVGKSMLGLLEAVDIATGRGILTGCPQKPLHAYYYNAEDDLATIQNRVSAILTHYGICQSELSGKLAIASGVGGGFHIVSGSDGEINEAQFLAMEETFLDAGIDVAILDPLQDLSLAPETNDVMRRLGERLRRMASRCQIAIGLMHHTRKVQAGSKATMDDFRGGSALRGFARFNRLLVPMSEADAARAGLPDHRPFFQIGDIEGNLAPPSGDRSRWFEKISVDAPNGESVGVVAAWTWPDADSGIRPEAIDACCLAVLRADEPQRESDQASAWVGHLIGPILGIDSRDKAGRTQLKSIVRKWVASGDLATESKFSKRDGRDIKFIVAGRIDEGESQ